MCELLLKSCLGKPDSYYLIESFPESMEDALFFEQNVEEIRYIINLTCSPEHYGELARRMQQFQKESNTEVIETDTLVQKIESYFTKVQSILKFYS